MAKSELPFINKYTLIARAYPATLCLVPVVFLTIGLANTDIGILVNAILSVKIFGCLAISVTAFFLLIHINRFIGKEIFENIYFKNELNMPSTLTLLPTTNTISSELFDKISLKTAADFNLYLPTRQESIDNELNSKKRIVEIVAQMRLKVKNGQLLLQHNIEYGFVRNLIGGAPLALIISIYSAIFYYHISNAAYCFALILSTLWLCLIVFSKFIIDRYGKLYAKRLIQEYLSL
jgi:hypothetical protein